jgi:hypothetical protein
LKDGELGERQAKTANATHLRWTCSPYNAHSIRTWGKIGGGPSQEKGNQRINAVWHCAAENSINAIPSTTYLILLQKFLIGNKAVVD